NEAAGTRARSGPLPTACSATRAAAPKDTTPRIGRAAEAIASFANRSTAIRRRARHIPRATAAVAAMAVDAPRTGGRQRRNAEAHFYAPPRFFPAPPAQAPPGGYRVVALRPQLILKPMSSGRIP